VAKLTLADITNILTSATTINNNNALIEAAVENTFSRDGTTPNEWTATMNSFTGGTLVHGSLLSLDQDDHTQYHNDTRGDARYYTQTVLDSGQLDTRYYTETELDAGQLDTRYYTETELDAGQLDTRYYTETEIDAALLGPLTPSGGTEAAPGYAFDGDTDTGVFSDTADEVGISAAGTERFTINGTQIISTEPHRGPDGNVTTPTYAFTSSTGTGVFLSGAGQLGMAAGGALAVTLTNAIADFQDNDVTTTGDVSVGNGSAAAPSYSFASDPDIGMYRVGTNAVGISTVGVERLRIEATGEISARTANYETLVTQDFDLTNKKYVDDALGYDLGEFTVAGLPTASSNANGYALATNASGGRTIVRSDGTNWKVVAVEGATVTT